MLTLFDMLATWLRHQQTTDENRMEPKYNAIYSVFLVKRDKECDPSPQTALEAQQNYVISIIFHHHAPLSWTLRFDVPQSESF